MQLDLRQRELELLGRQMRSYHGGYEELMVWLREAKQRQEDIQALPIGDGKALGQRLKQEKVAQLLQLLLIARLDVASSCSRM